MATASIADSVLGQYGLAEDPFSLSPDPRFLYLTNQHKAALAKLRYVMERRQGFAVLYGALFLGETITAGTVLGLVLILAGSYLGINGRPPGGDRLTRSGPSRSSARAPVRAR